MKAIEKDLISPLLDSGNVFKLRCGNCKSVSVQITEDKSPDYTCLECGGKCILYKEFIADKEDIIFSIVGIESK